MLQATYRSAREHDGEGNMVGVCAQLSALGNIQWQGLNLVHRHAKLVLGPLSYLLGLRFFWGEKAHQQHSGIAPPFIVWDYSLQTLWCWTWNLDLQPTNHVLLFFGFTPWPLAQFLARPSVHNNV